ncbi:MAG: hypothetical protein K9L56_14055 [Clostridiales bacterium]|nr:hypothetical protein [Clostridiales bacterium]
MGLTNAGRDFIAKAIINEGGTNFFTLSNTYIGVGDGSTAFGVTQTDLQGTNKTRSVVDSAPVRTGNELEFVTTFGDAEAQHDWLEWGVFNASTGGEMLNRKVENLGTKTGGTWVLTVTLAVNVG